MKKTVFLTALMLVSASVFSMQNPNEISQEQLVKNKELAIALHEDDIEQVVQSIDEGADINNTQINETTPLVFAVDKNNYDLTSILIGLGANVNGKGSDGRTALTVAIFKRNEQILNMLLNCENIDLEAVGMWGLSPLGVAMEMDSQAIDLENADASQIDMTKKLLEAGAKADGIASGDNKDTALMRAAMYGNEAMIRLLIKKGANIHARNRYGNTAFALAAEGNWSKAFELLKPLGPQDLVGAFSNAYKNKQTMTDDQIIELITKSSDIDTQNNNGYTPLMSSLESFHPECAKKLIDMGAKVNLQNNAGRTALMFAARNGYTKIVNLLLEKGARVNLTDKEGHSAQWFAEEKKHHEIVKILEEVTSNQSTKDVIPK